MSGHPSQGRGVKSVDAPQGEVFDCADGRSEVGGGAAIPGPANLDFRLTRQTLAYKV